jgi:hypothetical protein
MQHKKVLYLQEEVYTHERSECYNPTGYINPW